MLLRHAPELGRQKQGQQERPLSHCPFFRRQRRNFVPLPSQPFSMLVGAFSFSKPSSSFRAKDTRGAQRTGEMRRLTRADSSPRLRDDEGRKRGEQLDKSSPENIMTHALHHVIFISIPEELELLVASMPHAAVSVPKKLRIGCYRR